MCALRAAVAAASEAASPAASSLLLLPASWPAPRKGAIALTVEHATLGSSVSAAAAAARTRAKARAGNKRSEASLSRRRHASKLGCRDGKQAARWSGGIMGAKAPTASRAAWRGRFAASSSHAGERRRSNADVNSSTHSVLKPPLGIATPPPSAPAARTQHSATRAMALATAIRSGSLNVGAWVCVWAAC